MLRFARMVLRFAPKRYDLPHAKIVRYLHLKNIFFNKNNLTRFLELKVNVSYQRSCNSKYLTTLKQTVDQKRYDLPALTILYTVMHL